MLILTISVGPVIKGLVAAGAVIGLVALYVDRMSKISKNLDSLTDSIDEVHSDVSQVDLKHIEKTNNKLETYLDAELQNQYAGGNGRTRGQQSVYFEFDDLNFGATVSYVGDPSWHAGLTEHDDHDGSEIVFEIEFDEEVNTQGVIGMLANDDGLTEEEKNFFNSSCQPRMQSHSPYMVSVATPTGDMSKAAEWAKIIVNEIEEKISKIRDYNAKFDQEMGDFVRE